MNCKPFLCACMLVGVTACLTYTHPTYCDVHVTGEPAGGAAGVGAHGPAIGSCALRQRAQVSMRSFPNTSHQCVVASLDQPATMRCMRSLFPSHASHGHCTRPRDSMWLLRLMGAAPYVVESRAEDTACSTKAEVFHEVHLRGAASVEKEVCAGLMTTQASKCATACPCAGARRPRCWARTTPRSRRGQCRRAALAHQSRAPAGARATPRTGPHRCGACCMPHLPPPAAGCHLHLTAHGHLLSSGPAMGP